MRKPKVTLTARPAGSYARPTERIIEFAHPNGGGLISVQATDDGRVLVEVYRTDPTVDVRADRESQPSAD